MKIKHINNLIQHEALSANMSAETFAKKGFTAIATETFGEVHKTLAGAIDTLSNSVPFTASKVSESIEGKYHAKLKLYITVPNGLRKDYVGYTERLWAAVQQLEHYIPHRIDVFHKYVAQCIANPKLAKKNGLRFKHPAPQVQAGLRVFSKELERDNGGEAVYGDVISRESDWKTIIANTDLISKALDGEYMKRLKRHVEELDELIRVFAVQVESGEMVTYPRVAADMSQITYDLGAEVEYIGYLAAKSLELKQAVSTQK